MMRRERFTARFVSSQLDILIKKLNIIIEMKMSKKIRFYAIEVPFKLENVNESNRIIKSLIEFILPHTRKHSNFCQRIIAASSTSSWNLIGIKKVQKGKPKPCQLHSMKLMSLVEIRLF